MNGFWITAIGLLAQGFFSARILVQWIMSERARKVLSPSVFWILSIAGSYLLCIYGWLRQDFAIVLGQFISYYVYIWNLRIKGIWTNVPPVFRYVLIFTPLVAIGLVMGDVQNFINTFIFNEKVPMWLLIFGSAGQIIFTLRFLYQWYYSKKAGESELPPGFWWLSLLGSTIIVSYAVFRVDPVLILGQSFGLVAYSRNLWIGYKQRKNNKHKAFKLDLESSLNK